MSFFDQPYYALTKAHMCRIGMWPEQSKPARIIRRLTALALALTFVAPRLTRLNDIWENTDSLIHDMPFVLTGGGNIFIVLRFIQHSDSVKLSFDRMEKHWEMIKNTSAVVVLDKYAERGRYITVFYSTLICIVSVFYGSLCLSPIILDIMNPLNVTRSRNHFFYTSYGVDEGTYYWFILAHEYIVSMMAVAIVIMLVALFSTWAVHACALFEIVSFNLKLDTNKYMANMEKHITRCNDRNYKKICDCITTHEMAISFTELIVKIWSGPFATALICSSIMIIFTGIEALIYSKNRDILMQSVLFVIAQVVNLYVISVRGQELINHSEKIHTTAYDLEWPDMSVKAQKLLILIMIRSSKPCRFTARKVYFLSMESFGSTIRTVMSYFTIFAQMI